MKPLLVLLISLPLLGARVVPGRYIVELTGEPVATHMAAQERRPDVRGAAAREYRSRLREEQRNTRLRVEQQSAEVLDTADTVANALIVRISDASASRLAGLPGVARVRPAREFKMLLDRAVVVHKATDAWAQIGVERAGVGAKIAIIDTGIDVEHAGMRDPGLAMPDGFPKVNAASDLGFTTTKVIVARSYANLFASRDPDLSARDRVGHGTALAMEAAGALNAGPLATIMGVAPKAYLGSYKVFGSPGFNDNATDDAILKAIDDAVADGMDVINLSLGSDLAPRLEDDILVTAIERASALGVLVVVAAGNNGPDPNTIGSPASAPSAIAVGASANDRVFAASVIVDGVSPYVALPGSGPAPSDSIRGSVADVASVDGSGLACSRLLPGSLSNRIALIFRGVCTFEQKLNNAQGAGAVAALVYSDPDRPDPIQMYAGAATLPAEMVSYGGGLDLKLRLETQSDLQATLQFVIGPVSVNPNRLASFSARGPNVDSAIKPEVVAVGTNLYTATQSFDSRGEMFDPSGYIAVDGTSFSTPLVAGAAALLKSARPGLLAAQYRSLLIHSAAPIAEDTVQPARVQQVGAGVLDVSTALRSTISAYPAAINFGVGGPDPKLSRTLTISNVGAQPDTFSISVASRDAGAAPLISTNTVNLAPGASSDLTVDFAGTSLEAGSYEGFLKIQGSSSGVETRIPYWYAVPSGLPQHITLLDSATTGRRGSLIGDAFIFRITDASGVSLEDITPQVSVVSGGGGVMAVGATDIPGAYAVRVRLGALAGANVFRISAGDLSKDVAIVGR